MSACRAKTNTVMLLFMLVVALCPCRVLVEMDGVVH